MIRLAALIGIVFACACSFAALGRRPALAPSTPAAQIQAQLDALPRSSGTITARTLIGGTVQLAPGEVNLGMQPLYIGSCVRLRGAGRCATRLIYRGTGPAIRFRSYADHGQHQAGSIEDLSICSEGDGIGIADDAPNEGSEMLVRNVTIDCAGRALNFRHANGNALYFVDIDHVNVTGAGNGILDFLGQELHANRLLAASNTRTVKSDLGSAIRVSGSGIISGCRVENDWGGPALQLIGSWTISGTWIETTRGAAILNKADVVVDHTSMWFAQPKQPIILQNGSSLSVTGQLGWTDDGGGKDTTIDRCYRVDDKSQVREGSRVVVGAQPK